MRPRQNKTKRRTREGKEHYTVRALAAEMSVAPATIRRYVTTGQLSAYRLDNGEFRITPESFQAFQEARAVLAAGPFPNA